VIAAIGIGALDDWSDAARFVALDPPVVPDESRRVVYDDAYRTWLDLGAAVTPVSHTLARRTPQRTND
jgi:xylulokinase